MKILRTTSNQILAKWFVCRVTSGRKSAWYGIRFSYPLYVSLVAIGIFFVNPYILSVTAMIAFFGILLPMHPFDYVYNFGVTKLIGTDRIPGRGSELQVNSSVAFLFTLGVIVSIMYEMQLHYGIMALLYVISSIFFIFILLSTDNFSFFNLLNKSK